MKTYSERSREERKIINSYLRFVRAANSTTDIVSRDLIKNGLTPSQYGVLDAILHRGPLCLGELAKRNLKSNANLTLVVDNLEKRQLVKRSRDSKDRRMITVYLTEEGEKLISELFPRHIADINDAMKALSLEELKELGRLCRKLSLSHKQLSCE